MSTETPTPTPTPAPAPKPAPPTTDPITPPATPAQEPTDWKVEATKWEKRAKENFDKAQAHDALVESQKTEEQKRVDENAALRATVKGYETKEQIATWKAKVSTETGVPVAALSGSTLEALQAHAAILKPLIEKAGPPEDDGKPHVPYRDLSKVLADAPNPSPGMGTLRAAYATKQ